MMRKVPSAPNLAEEETKQDESSNSTPAGQRHIARSTLLAVGARASELTSSMKSSSFVFRYGIETVDKLLTPAKSFTLAQWNYYGEPILNTLDQKIDSFVTAREQQQQQRNAQAERDAEEKHQLDRQQTSYMLYWDGLKARLINSKWFAGVDEILLQNNLVKGVTSKIEPLVRPAEVFFNTATEVYLTDGDTWDAFSQALRERLGPAWDVRLAPPAKAFYSTAKTVQTLVGAGKFFGGAIQLGKQKLNSAIDDLMARWDQVLTSADDAVENWLPDEQKDGVSSSLALTETNDDDDDDEDDDDDDDEDFADEACDYADESSFAMEVDRTAGKRGSMGSDAAADVPYELRAEVSEEEDAIVEEQILDHGALSSPHLSAFSSDSPKILNNGERKRRSMVPIAEKVSKRIRQRIPLVTELPTQLKTRLVQSEWFQKVDDILRENVIVQMMQLQMMAAAALNQVVRPAEHFYNTAAQIYRNNTRSSSDFLALLKERMGSAWDDRLTGHAVSFFRSASQVAGIPPSPSINSTLHTDPSVSPLVRCLSGNAVESLSTLPPSAVSASSSAALSSSSSSASFSTSSAPAAAADTPASQ